MNFNGIKPISARKSMSAVTWTSAVQAGGVAQWRAILEGHDGMWCLTFGEAGAGAERRVPCRWRSSPAAFRLPPSACRLPPVACRLPPVACRLPPLACRLPSRRLPPKDRTPHAPHRRRAFWGANRRTPRSWPTCPAGLNTTTSRSRRPLAEKNRRSRGAAPPRYSDKQTNRQQADRQQAGRRRNGGT